MLQRCALCVTLNQWHILANNGRTRRRALCGRATDQWLTRRYWPAASDASWWHLAAAASRDQTRNGRSACIANARQSRCIGSACLFYGHATTTAEFRRTTPIVVARVVWLCSSDTHMERFSRVETFGSDRRGVCCWFWRSRSCASVTGVRFCPMTGQSELSTPVVSVYISKQATKLVFNCRKVAENWSQSSKSPVLPISNSNWHIHVHSAVLGFPWPKSLSYSLRESINSW